jgi:CRP-like cAMP-binding protein
MDPTDRLRTLLETGWLATRPEAFLARVLDSGRLRSVQPGEPLYRMGDEPGGIFGLAEGFADVLLASGPFPPFLAHIARPGSWMGEAAALTNTRRRVEIRARTPLQVLYLAPASLLELEASCRDLWRHIGQIAVYHMDIALMLAASLAQADVRSKLTSTLIRLAGPLMHVDAETFIPCSQQELGEMAALSRNSVGPVLKQMERESLIARRTYGQIAFNPVRLARTLP